MHIADKIKISIIVPVYNREDFLDFTIKSVLSQTYSNWELILVDDGSTDNSVEICKKYEKIDSRVKLLFRDQSLKGASVCRNIGLQFSSSSWVMFLDSDDLLAPWCLQQRVNKIIKNVDCDFLVFPMLLFKHEITDMLILQNVNTDENPLDRFLKRENVWLMSSVIWSKKFLLSIGGFSESLLSFQDWELNIRALLKTENYIFFDQAVPDNFYRQHSNTISNSRHTELHLSNNLKMIMDCYVDFKNSIFFTEDRKGYFISFLVEWLLRLNGIPMPSGKRKSITKDSLIRALNANMLSLSLFYKIRFFLFVSGSKISMKFPFTRKISDKFFKLLLPKYIFTRSQKFQGRIKYNKELFFSGND